MTCATKWKSKSLYQESVPVRMAIGNSGYCEFDMDVKFYAEKIGDELFISIKSIGLDTERQSVYDDVTSYLEDVCVKYGR